MKSASAVLVLAAVLALAQGANLRWGYFNVGNNRFTSAVDSDCGHLESSSFVVSRTYRPKLCGSDIVTRLKGYINHWTPDVMLFTEIWKEEQMKGDINGSAGPLLPPGYDYVCRRSKDTIGENAVAEGPPEEATHEHLCIAWKTSKASQVGQPTDIDSFETIPAGMSDGESTCYGDYGTFSVDLSIDGLTIRFTTFHSSISNTECRDEQIAALIGHVRGSEYSVWAGDFEGIDNIDSYLPEGHFTTYSRGSHFGGDKHADEFTSVNGESYTHSVMNFGSPCTDCGEKVYGTTNLRHGSAVGPFDGHERWDGYEVDASELLFFDAGGDHFQILTDVTFPAPSDNTGLGTFLKTPLGVLAIVGMAVGGAALLGAIGLFVLRRATADPYGEAFAKNNPAPFGGEKKEEPAGWRTAYQVNEPTGEGMKTAEVAPYTAIGGPAAPAPRRASGGSKRRAGGSSRGSKGSRRAGGSQGSRRGGSNGSKRSGGGSGRHGNVGSGARRNVPSALDPTSFNYGGQV